MVITYSLNKIKNLKLGFQFSKLSLNEIMHQIKLKKEEENKLKALTF